MADWFKDALAQMPMWWRIVLTIGAILSSGFGAGVLFVVSAADLQGLPARVELLEGTVQTLREDLSATQRSQRRMEQKMDRMLCNLNPGRTWSECERAHPTQ